VVPGAPVSVLMEHGLPEKMLEKLLEGGISTVEKLGNMTPEELEEIPGIGPKMVEKIQDAVVSYYGQYEESVDVPQSDESQQQVENGETEELAVAPSESDAVVLAEPTDPDHTESARIKDAE